MDRVKYSFRITQRFAVVLLPLLAVATAAACYYFTRRTPLPVKQMTDTVQQIQKDGDPVSYTHLELKAGMETAESDTKGREENSHE